MPNIENQKEMPYIPITSVTSDTGDEIAEALFYYNIQAVNICLVGNERNFVLIDAGMPKSTPVIKNIIEDHFGTGARPKAILLTHGHFDHVGAVTQLTEEWNIPAYAHQLELPYLTGQKSYPEPDPSVEGGLIAKISKLFPNEPIHLGNNVAALPSDGSVPYLDEWQWIHTPGHTPGHVSFYRKKDGSFVVGDAFVTVRQDALFKVLTQEQEVTGPPRYLTTDWQAAFESVKKLYELHPKVAVTGHGTPMRGEELMKGLQKLVDNFDKLAVPDYGRYVQ
jgi:glyoxylase-like metal-dependent hydrolase (beta-lactamase superfamily II)